MDALTAAQRAKVRRAIASLRAEEPSAESGELNVVPFLDIVTNVLMFVLAGLALGFTTNLDVRAPSRSRSAPIDAQELTVILTHDGYIVKGHGGSIAPGCASVGSGVTIPLRDGYDAGALTRCARRLKDEVARSQRQIMLGANPDVPAQEVIRAMDALRSDADGELFPDVVLVVPSSG
jgi:biopolymer transport protein ExbD